MRKEFWDDDHEIGNDIPDFTNWGFPIAEEEDVENDEPIDEEIENEVEDEAEEVEEESEEEEEAEEEEQEEEEREDEEEGQEEKGEEEEVKFKTYKEKADYLDKKLKELSEQYNEENLKKKITENYKDELLNAEQEVEQVKALYQAIKGNPTAFIKHFLGDPAKQMGYNTQLSREEKKAAVHYEMQRKFGVGYETEYNQEEMLDPTSTSFQMYEYAKSIVAELDQKAQQQAQPAPMTNIFEDPAYLDLEYKEKFESKGVSKDDYNTFVKDLHNRFPNLSMLDMHRAIYYDDYMNVAYKKGIEEGKKMISKELKNINGKMKPVVKNTQPEQKKNLTEDDIFDYYRNKHDYSTFRGR